MGDIFRKINICGLTPGAKRLGQVPDTQVLVDPGATKSVISTSMAKRLRGAFLIDVPIEGRKVPTKLTAIQLNAPGCGEQPIVVAVDDQLVRRAGHGPDGKPIEVILGHDYLEAERVGFRYMDRDDEVVCQAAPLATTASQRTGKVARGRTRRNGGRSNGGSNGK